MSSMSARGSSSSRALADGLEWGNDAARVGRATLKVVPEPTWLRTLISPCIASTSRLQMYSPRPAPPPERVTESAVTKKRSKMRRWSTSEMPGPRSLTDTQALEIAGPGSEDVVPVFITIDPERDTKDVLAEYVSHFHPRLIGLTGTPEQIKQAEDGYRVFAAKAGGTPGKADYMMDHTGYIYLMDKNGKYLAHFGKDAQPREIAARLRRELRPQ